MLELKINPKDIHQDPFAIMTWKDADLAMAVMIFKPVRKGDNKQKSYQRILIGDERSILSRLRGEETVSQKVRVEAYTVGSLFKEFCRQFALASMRRFRVKLKAYTELTEDLQQRQADYYRIKVCILSVKTEKNMPGILKQSVHYSWPPVWVVTRNLRNTLTW